VRKLFLLLLVAAAGGSWYVFQKYRIEGFDRIALKPRGQSSSATDLDPDADAAPLAQRQQQSLRVASFDIQKFDSAKLANPKPMKTVLELIRRYDVVAIQGIATPRDDLMPQLVEQLNIGGRHFDYVIGPRSIRDTSPEQFAFVFDAASVEVDRSTMYTVEDPGRLMRRDPLVATFRVRGPDAKDAFTFTLVNVHVDPERAPGELAALADVYRAVRNNGFGEDDVIMLGNLGADSRRLGLLGQLPNMTAALSMVPTTTHGTKMYDNILFNRDATTEFTGRCGVVDLMQEFGLTLPQALEVSDHLPIWAEFSIYEGGERGRMAAPSSTGMR
jgi:deoxyribonuclease-1-like protein